MLWLKGIKAALTPAGWLAVAGAVALLCAVAAWFATEPARERQKAASAHAIAVQSQGGAKAATDAVAVVVTHDKTEQATDQTAKANSDAIRQTEGSSVPVNPDAVRVGRVGLCKYAAYQHSAQCLQQANPR